MQRARAQGHRFFATGAGVVRALVGAFVLRQSTRVPATASLYASTFDLPATPAESKLITSALSDTPSRCADT